MSTSAIKGGERDFQVTKIWNRLFITVFIANVGMNLSQQMTNSLVSKYADSLGATKTMVGLVSSMFAITALLFKVLSGPVIDTYNRRFILAGAMAVMAVSFFGYSTAGAVPTLMVFRLVQGAGQAFTTTCCLALAADTLPKDKFGSGIGVFSMAQAASQAIGPALALALVDVMGYSNTFRLGCLIMCCSAFLAATVKVPFERTKKFKISLKSIIAKEAILPAVIIFVLSLAFFVINSFLVIFAGEQGLPSAQAGYFFTAYAGTMLFTRPMVGRLVDRFGTVRVLIPAIICFALSFFIISVTSALPVLLLAGFVSAFGYGACMPAMQTLAMKCVSPERRGASSSTNYIGTDLGSLLGPVLAGAVADKLGYIAMWRIMTVPIFAGLIIVIACRSKINRVEKNFDNMQKAG